MIIHSFFIEVLVISSTIATMPTNRIKKNLNSANAAIASAIPHFIKHIFVVSFPPIYFKRLLVITPMVTPIDVKNIKEKCFELAEGNVTERSEFLSLLSPDSISFVEGRYKKKDIIVMATEKMIEEGFVKSEFLDDIYAREHVEVTAIGNGVAIPHGKPENVISSQIRIIKLKRPVDWGNGHKVDLVFFLALNFDNFKKTKAFFKDFTRILNSKDGLSHIKESKNEQEFYARLIKEVNPKVFIFENVTGLLNHDKGKTWEIIQMEPSTLDDNRIAKQ